MLRPEIARERLKDAHDPNWIEPLRAAVSALPRALRPLAWGLVARDKKGEPVRYHLSGETRRRALHALGAADDGERLQILTALFADLAPTVDAAWRMMADLPYPTGYARRAFRAPESAALHNPRRGRWLNQLFDMTAGYPRDLLWLAAWAPYLGRWNGSVLGYLFAAGIDQGGEQGETLFQLLVDSAMGEHPTGGMGRHVTTALLVASRPDGWDLMERMLLAAQRQEGLRQVILESVDQAHPTPFRRMLTLIREQELTRFSAVIRAVDVWFGMGWEAARRRQVDAALLRVEGLMDDPARREAALQGSDPEEIYCALWTIAFHDAPAALEAARPLLAAAEVSRRGAALALVVQLGLPAVQPLLAGMLDDEDLRIVALAVSGLLPAAGQGTDLFDCLERQLPRVPVTETKLESLLWPWDGRTIGRSDLFQAMLAALGTRSPARMAAYLNEMDLPARSRLVHLLTESGAGEPADRALLLRLLADRSISIRERALRALATITITGDEARELEGLLTRRSGDLRRGVLALLLGQPDPAVLASAQRLLAEKKASQRAAGLELLVEMVEGGRGGSAPVRAAQAYRATLESPTQLERPLLERLASREAPVATLDDALGLMDPADRTPVTPPTVRRRFGRRVGPKLSSPAALRVLQELDALIHTHRDAPVTVVRGQRSEQVLLGNLRGLPLPDPALSREENLKRLPLREIWEPWESERGAGLRDDDGLELLRALGLCGFHRFAFAPQLQSWLEAILPKLGCTELGLRYGILVESILRWLLFLHPVPGAPLLLDAVEYTFALIPRKVLQPTDVPNHWHDVRNNGLLMRWLAQTREFRNLGLGPWGAEEDARLWRLLRWLDEPGTGTTRLRPDLVEVAAAHDAGAATDADLYDHLIGPRGSNGGWGFRDLSVLTSRRGRGLLQQYPALVPIVERCRERLLEVELARGELPTAATAPIRMVRTIEGARHLLQFVQRLGRGTLERGWSRDGSSRKAIFSHLIRVTRPAPDDHPEQFAALVAAAGTSEKRLLEVAAYAPQWASFIEHTLGWEGLAEGVWWLHAHTKDRRWSVGAEIREQWGAEIARHTPISASRLVEGAVDVAWFQRLHRRLGAARWEALEAAAKYTATGGGHSRAQLFARAMRGQVEATDLMKRIDTKRHQDSVRALGLLPLPEGEARADALLERYRAIQQFMDGSRAFGSQRRASERLAAEIGMENLARSAGYPDPLRLRWAMEQEALGALAAGPRVVQIDETTVTLAIEPTGAPQLTVQKGKRTLKRLPARLKKVPEIADLLEQRREIAAQAKRSRGALEEAMIRGDLFLGSELPPLLAHPVLAPMIRTLVFIGEQDAGVLTDEGRQLESAAGRRRTLDPGERLRIAHPTDLYAGGDWHLWQRRCFAEGWRQPFKQIYRELYLITGAEQGEGDRSRRYAGQQVNPKQALAILGQRGWVAHHEIGITRTDHHEGLVAHLELASGPFTPLEVEGLTLESLLFTRRESWEPVPLIQVPPRLFSEVMRDLDLIVSVAHQGGVDPEASASTVEMRAALVRESCALLKIDNVQLRGHHVLIAGGLGDYSIHLGSGVVHRQPGGALCLVAVPGQHRGRLFLPFADDDPRTAEVVSKVLLLARDHDIKDPTVLEQILSG